MYRTNVNLNSYLASSLSNNSNSPVVTTSVSNYDCLRILVLGDSGVGKSSLVNILCHGTVLTNPMWTIGASVEVKLHFYKEASTEQSKQKPVIIEFFDIGGSLQHKSSRHIFYTNYHGVIFVHDLTNKKSLKNLFKWKNELISKSTEQFSSTSEGGSRLYDYRVDHYLSVPVLMVGTKSDIVPSPARLDRVTLIGKEIGAYDTIKVNCLNPNTVQAGSSCAVTLSKFYDKVIEHSSNHKYSASNNNSNFIQHPTGASLSSNNKLLSSSTVNYSKVSSSNLTRIHIE